MSTGTEVESGRHPLSELERPVFSAATTQMKVDVVVNERNDAWLFYDAPLRETVKWVDYDLDANAVTLVFMSGRQQGLGLVIPEPVAASLQHSKKICLMQVKGGQVMDCGVVPLFTRGRLNLKPRI